VKRAAWTGLVLLTLFVVATPVARGQTRDGRGLFGGAGQRPAEGLQPLVASITTSAVRDEDSRDPGVRQEFADLEAAVLFARQRPRFEFRGGADSSFRRYPALGNLESVSRSTHATLTARVGRKTTIRARLDGRYVSSAAFDLFAAESALDVASPLPTGFADASVDWATTSYGGTVGLERVVGKRSSIGVTSGLRWAVYGQSALGRDDQRDQEGTIQTRYSKSFGKASSTHLAYTFRRTRQEFARTMHPLDSHDLQLTFDSRWRHSAYRQSVLTFGGGPSLQEPQISTAGTTSPERLLRFVGVVAFAHDLSNGWTARASYRRGAGFRDTVAFSDTYAADIMGRFGRRVDLTVSAGRSDIEGSANPLDDRRGTSFGSAHVLVGLTELVAAYAQYYRYHHAPRDGTRVLASSRDVDRQGIRIGVTIWLPLVRR
jgi:hypothetical protein